MATETVIQRCLTCGEDFTWQCGQRTLRSYLEKLGTPILIEKCKFFRLHDDYCTPCTEEWEKRQT